MDQNRPQQPRQALRELLRLVAQRVVRKLKKTQTSQKDESGSQPKFSSKKRQDK